MPHQSGGATTKARTAHEKWRPSRTLNMGQDGVSRLEKRSDLLPSTLRNYVEAVGGSLTLVAQFPEQEPIAIAGFGEIATPKENGKAKRRAAHAR